MPYHAFLVHESAVRRVRGRALLSQLLITMVLSLMPAAVAGAQQPPAPISLPALIQSADTASPAIRSASAKAAAARARVRLAGARADPMLMIGVINVPVNTLSLREDEMTMKMVGIDQNLPYPGKLGLRQKAAAFQADAAAASAEGVQVTVRRDVKIAYYELSYIDAALVVLEQSNSVLNDIVRVANARYSAGTGMQQDVLRARLDAARLNESANSLREQRGAVLSRLNGMLNRQGVSPVDHPSIPPSIVGAAVAASSDIRFSSNTLGASAIGSPLPSLSELQALALQMSPSLRSRAAMIASANAELALARKDHLPDVDVSLQYGQRTARPDMVSAVLSIPIPIQRSRKQNIAVAAGRSDLGALEAEQRDAENAVRSEVARLYSDITHSRTQLALYVKAIIPQGRATLASATAGYQSGPGDLIPVLNARTSLFELESGYHRAMTDFAQKIAELEAVIGKELLP